jgi:hypothetical protein
MNDAEENVEALLQLQAKIESYQRNFLRTRY